MRTDGNHFPAGNVQQKMEALPTYAAYITPENRNLAYIAAI